MLLFPQLGIIYHLIIYINHTDNIKILITYNKQHSAMHSLRKIWLRKGSTRYGLAKKFWYHLGVSSEQCVAIGQDIYPGLDRYSYKITEINFDAYSTKITTGTTSVTPLRDQVYLFICPTGACIFNLICMVGNSFLCFQILISNQNITHQAELCRKI